MAQGCRDRSRTLSFQLVTCLLFTAASAEGKAEVLLYVANEPSPTAPHETNLKRIASWLKSSPLAGDHLLAEGLVGDLTWFPASVDADVKAIVAGRARLSGVLIATNRLLQSGAVLVGREGSEPAREPIQLEVAADDRAASNPIASAANLSRVLDVAQAQFPADKFTFVIAIHSHGDEVYALTPRLGLPTEGLTEETLLNRVHGSDNAFVERYGITTADLLALLAERRRTRGLETSLLVLSSCESTIEELVPEVPRALVAAGGASLPFDAIDYAKVLASKADTLAGAFTSTLTPAPFEFADPAAVRERRRAAKIKEVVERLPYFAPLLLWFVAVAVYRRRVKARPVDS